MESYELDVIKLEKLKAMRRYRTFQKITTAVKTLEIFIGIVLVSWTIASISARVPVVVEFAGKFLRRISALVFSPHFVFVLGNAIVIALFANSRDRTSSSSSADVISDEVSAEENSTITETPANVTEKVILPAEEKQQEEEKKKTYERTRSALEIVTVEKKELRRSVTDPHRSIAGKSPVVRRMHEVDELSSDEFRRKVEAFIEKQQRILRAESSSSSSSNKSVVVYNNSRCNSL